MGKNVGKTVGDTTKNVGDTAKGATGSAGKTGDSATGGTDNAQTAQNPLGLSD